MAPESQDRRDARPASPGRRRWRYLLVVGLIWAAVVVAAATGWRYARTSGPAFGPVILVSIDSLRADHLPIYGYRTIQTPAIDALAADAIVFDRAYAHSPLTLPSNVTLLSGRLPFETGVRDDAGFTVGASLALLPQLLHRRGFKTGGVVSNALLRKETGLGQAFGFFDDELGGPGSESPAPRRDGLASVRVAERWIESIGTARFFLFLHLDEPAAPGRAVATMASRSAYDRAIVSADGLVGRLVEFLKARKLYDEAVLVVLSDHGEGLGSHGERGHGLLLHEEVLRTPLLVKLPRNANGGQRAAALAQQIDVAPTILDLVAAPRPSSLRGRSLRGILESPETTIANRQIYAESLAGWFRFGWSPLSAITTDRYRFVSAPRPELYDLQLDQRERKNVYDAQAQTAGTLRKALDRVTAGFTLQPPAPPTDEERSRLGPFGYVFTAPGIDPAAAAEQLADPKEKIGVYEKYRQAGLLADGGQTADAIATCQSAVTDDRTLAAAWDRLGGLLVQAGRLKEAGAAYASLAALYQDAGRPSETEAVVQRLLAGPVTADRYVLAARVWTALGDKPRAAAVRADARKAVGDAALRKAEAAQR